MNKLIKLLTPILKNINSKNLEITIRRKTQLYEITTVEMKNVELDQKIISDAGVGLYFVEYHIPDTCYGMWNLGLYIGRHLLSVSDNKRTIEYCDYYATGTGG